MKTHLNKTCSSSACKTCMLANFGFFTGSLTLIFVLALALVFQSPASAATKNPVTVQKVLSLDLCTDWILAKHASPSQVLALSPLMKQYPVDWVGQDWPTHNGSLEQILELKPDLVITGEYNALMLRRRLQELGVRVEILPLPKNLSQVSEYEQRLLSLIGKSKDKASKPPRLKPSSHPKQKLLLLGANGIGTGRNTFENDLLQYAGWDNYLMDKGYINLDLEQIATNPPDAILWAAPSSAALSNLFAKHPVLKQAIPAKQWLKTDAWNWQCPGPWTWDLIGQLQASAQR